MDWQAFGAMGDSPQTSSDERGIREGGRKEENGKRRSKEVRGKGRERCKER